MDCEIDKMILNKMAVQKLSTANPPTISLHNIIISAFITNRNNPKVISVTGNVSRMRMGLINTFKSPRTIATIMEVLKLATETPGIKWAMTMTRMAVRRIRSIKFITTIFYKNKKTLNKKTASNFIK